MRALITLSLCLAAAAPARAAPEQVHIAYCEPASGCMTVAWASANKGDSFVEYGASVSTVTNRVDSSGSTYSVGSYTSPYLFFATLPNLQPATTYFYRVAGEAGLRNFTTAPQIGPDVPFSFVLIGDLGQTSDSADTLSHVQQESDAQAIVFAGPSPALARRRRPSQPRPVFAARAQATCRTPTPTSRAGTRGAGSSNPSCRACLSW